MIKRILFVAVIALGLLPGKLAAQQAATKEQLDEVKGALDGLNESYNEYKGYIDAMRKLKITGYLQTQFRYTDLINTPFTVGNFSGGAFPANTKNLFQVRRGRLKFNYDNTLTQFVIQGDFINTGFTLKDAFLSVTEPWSKTFGLQMGVFDRPFGYEISFSSSSRETPERSRLFQTLFPGERDLGAKLIIAPPSGPLSIFRLDLGLFNGVGPNANEVDNFKDVIGHLGVQLPFAEENVELDFGVSGYMGAVRSNSNQIWTIADPGTGVKKFVRDSSAANTSLGVDRTYYGADVQLYVNVLPFGGTILRGEYITGKQPGTSGSNASLQGAIGGDVYKRDFNGYYAYLVQNIGTTDQIVLKYDVLNPNTSVSTSDFRAGTNLSVNDLKYTTIGLGLVHHWDDNVKFILYYELISNDKLDPALATSAALLPYVDNVRDNVLTLRVQYKF